METWAAGLIGAVVGALSSIGGIWIQSRYQHRREMAKIIMESASKDRDGMVELALKQGKSVALQPVVLFVHYHSGLFKLIEKGKLNGDNLQKLHADNRKMATLIQLMDDQRRRELLQE